MSFFSYYLYLFILLIEFVCLIVIYNVLLRSFLFIETEKNQYKKSKTKNLSKIGKK